MATSKIPDHTKTVRATVIMPEDLHTELVEYAHTQDRKMSPQAVHFIKKGLRDAKRNPEDQP